MRKILQLFSLKKEERWPAAVMLMVLVFFNTLIIIHYHHYFSVVNRGYWSIFFNHFKLSGFDPYTYSIVSHWNPLYDITRHPLLAYYVWPLSAINQWLTEYFGYNPVQSLVASFLILSGFYSYLFLYRILREVLLLIRFDAILLSYFCFSFAYILLPLIAPDHFGISFFCLLFVLYVTGIKIRNGTSFKVWQTILLFIITAGVTLSNGIKVFLAAFFTNGRRFFKPTFLIIAVILPSIIIWAFARWEYYNFHNTDKPDTEENYMTWIDTSTPRIDNVVNNLLGESIQLHQENLLEDALRTRPIIVKYRHGINYIVESSIVLLFIIGIYYGRKDRFLWLILSWLSFDMFLHLVLGFGLNEVYIMGAHWLFIIPLTISYLFIISKHYILRSLRLILLLLTIWLYLWNGSLLIKYLFSPA